MSPSDSDPSSSDSTSSRSLTLTTGGITLLGVLISLGLTVGFGVSGEWWVRVLAGVGTTLVGAAAVKLGTSSGRGPLARLSRWMIGEGEGEGSRRDEADGGGKGGRDSSGAAG